VKYRLPFCLGKPLLDVVQRHPAWHSRNPVGLIRDFRGRHLRQRWDLLGSMRLFGDSVMWAGASFLNNATPGVDEPVAERIVLAGNSPQLWASAAWASPHQPPTGSVLANKHSPLPRHGTRPPLAGQWKFSVEGPRCASFRPTLPCFRRQTFYT